MSLNIALLLLQHGQRQFGHFGQCGVKDLEIAIKILFYTAQYVVNALLHPRIVTGCQGADLAKALYQHAGGVFAVLEKFRFP